MAEIDRIPLSQLPSRFGIARSALYTRLKDLQIEPIRDGKKAYLDAPSLELLDKLHQHIQGGGTTNEFLKQKALTSTGLSRTPENIASVQDSLGHLMITTIMHQLLSKTGDRLSYLRELEEASTKGWLLASSELADLLGLTPKTIAAYGGEFATSGFLFRRAGKKSREIAWTVTKV